MNEGMVAIRRQGKGDLGVKTVAEFLADAVEEIKERKSE